MSAPLHHSTSRHPSPVGQGGAGETVDALAHEPAGPVAPAVEAPTVDAPPTNAGAVMLCGACGAVLGTLVEHAQQRRWRLRVGPVLLAYAAGECWVCRRRWYWDEGAVKLERLVKRVTEKGGKGKEHE